MNNSMENVVAQMIKDGVGIFMVYLVLSVALFFIIREITLWYFKINKNTQSLEKIAYALEDIAIAAKFFTKDSIKKHNSEAATERLNDEIVTKKMIIPKEDDNN